MRTSRLIRAAALSLVAMLLAACGTAVGNPAAAATVNGRHIPLAEVERRFDSVRRDPQLAVELAQDPDGSFKARVQARILTRMIHARLLGEAAAQMGITISAADIAAERARIVEQVGGQAAFDEIVEQNKLTEQDVRDQIRELLVEQRLATEVGKRVTVSEADIRAYFEQQKATRYQRVRASHILLPDEEAAQAAAARVRAGEDFAAVARELSQDESSAAQGGDLGEFTRGRLVPEFEEAAFAAPVGEIVGPVRSQIGWHVIKVTGRIEPALDEVRDQIRAELLQQRQAEAQSSLRRQHFVGADVRINPRLGRWNPEVGEVEAGDPLGPTQAVDRPLTGPAPGPAGAPGAAPADDGHEHEH